MILVDANLLIYGVFTQFPQHERARAWLEKVLNEPARVGLPWPSLLSFVRLATNPRLFSPPLSLSQAWGQVREWLDLTNVWIPLPTERHTAVLEALLLEAQATADKVMDAHVAALAYEHGLQVCSADSDFAGFTGISWVNPLKGPD